MESVREVLAKCQTQWLSSGYVHLHNYFCEMPVVAKAKLLGLDGERMTVQASAAVGRVFACTDDMREARITSPDNTSTLIAGMFDCRDGVITLVVRSVEAAQRERRESVRIRLPEPVALKLMHYGEVQESLYLDMSASGLRLRLPQHAGRLTPGEQLMCIWLLEGQKVVLEAIVRWVCDVHGGQQEAGVKFISPGPFGEQLGKYMFLRQQNLAGRLKQLAAPSWMRGE